MPEHRARQPVLVGHHQDQVTGSGAGDLQEGRALRLGEEPVEWRVERSGSPVVPDHLEPRQPLGAQLPGPVGEAVQPGPGELGPALEDDRLHAGRPERLHPGPLEHRGQIDQLHAEADVRLVRAVAVDGLGPRHARDVVGPDTGDHLGGVEHRLGHEGEHVLLGDEGGLDVQLAELELPVGPQILVTEAAGYLVVPVHPGHHEQLFGQLRALGQDVAGPGRQPARHGELTRPFGGRGPQQRRLDLDEALPVHGRPERTVDGGPQPEVGLHPRPPEVDEAVLQPGHLVHLDPVVDGEGRRFGGVEERHRALAELDVAGGQVRVGRTLGAGPDDAFDGDHVLAAHVDRPRHHALEDSRVVAQVDERQMLTVLPPFGHPAAHRHR